MKKTILITSIVLMALAALGVGVVFAQGNTGSAQTGYGWMHDYIEQALAAKLGLTEVQVEDQLASGKTMYQVALDNGIQKEDIATFMNDVHKDAFANAVRDGVITQGQADSMLQRMQNMQGMMGNGLGQGACPMHNGQVAPNARGNGYGPGMMGNGGGMMWGQGAQNR